MPRKKTDPGIIELLAVEVGLPTDTNESTVLVNTLTELARRRGRLQGIEQGAQWLKESFMSLEKRMDQLQVAPRRRKPRRPRK